MKSLRMLLYPFSVLYDGVTRFRNYLFDKGILESTSFDIPVISVGNLSVGGTGKSPMIEYLISMLHDKYQVAVLSRGYKRKTKGYLEVQTGSTTEEVGDEPLQFKINFPDVRVAVCTSRRKGIQNLKQHAEIILLDDAFQHRKVAPSLQILLTAFDDLYLNDYLLPAGNLRESARGAKRADIIIVTKCPEGVAYSKLQEIQYRFQLKENQKVYFSRIGYDSKIFSNTETLPLHYLQKKYFTLVTGIANPSPLKQFLDRQGFTYKCIQYPDHHNFSNADIIRLQKEELILTTEKDYMRLQNRLQKFALYYLPIKTVILHEQESFLKERILKSIRQFRKS